ncbi:MAG: hypothetical protein V7647_2723 [Acidobacteriota bacterium]|jgi:hypothetical protein
MRRVVIGLCVTLLFTCRLAQAAAISVAGADCGTDPLLGLTFTTLTGSSGGLDGAGCPTGGFGLGAIAGSGGPLYGPVVNSIEFSISDPGQVVSSGLTVTGGAIGSGPTGLVEYTETGFRLSGGFGIYAPCTFIGEGTSDGPCGFKDALITFSGFEAGTQFTVVAVNGISSVPEPGTLGLLLTGLGGAVAGRRWRVRGREAR